MEGITLPVYNTEGKEIDSIKLDAKVFDGVINAAAIYQAVNAYRANQRKGLASTKTRGEVSGGGRKPWRQKGTGRARVGSIRSPLWRHGGVIFGPHPRDFSYRLPKKIRILALRSSLNAKVKENNLIILDHMKLDHPKTKEALKIFANLKIKFFRHKNLALLLLLDKIDPVSKLAMRNINSLNVGLAVDTHAYEILRHKKVVITKPAFRNLMDRISPEKTLTSEKAKNKES